MSHTESAKYAPFPIDKFGNRVGKGKDNMVVGLPITKRADDFVIKINHDRPRTSLKDSLESLRYKKEKYEILKLFLGDFIPTTHFVLGTKEDSGGNRTAEYSIQQRVPNNYLSSLSREQQQDPRLVYNMMLLMTKMENMYRALGNINARTGGESANLDAKLDLGGISGYVRDHIDSQITYDTASTTIRKKGDTPNILVDPATMDIFCVDFDEGRWTDDKSIAKDMLFDLVESRPSIQSVIRLQASELMLDPNLTALAIS